jgi:hypothetical protein
MSEPMSDEQRAEIRRRNDYLRNIPFDTHGPGIHGDNCPPCGMVRGIGDVTALLAALEQQQGRLEWGVRWTDRHGETHDDAKADEAKAREFVQVWQKNLPGYAAELICRTKAGDWQEVPDGE